MPNDDGEPRGQALDAIPCRALDPSVVLPRVDAVRETIAWFRDRPA